MPQGNNKQNAAVLLVARERKTLVFWGSRPFWVHAPRATWVGNHENFLLAQRVPCTVQRPI